MSAQINQGTGPCCAPLIKGYRLLTFPDGSQAGRACIRFLMICTRKGKSPARRLPLRLSEGSREIITSPLLQEINTRRQYLKSM